MVSDLDVRMLSPGKLFGCRISENHVFIVSVESVIKSTDFGYLIVFRMDFFRTREGG